MLRDLLALFYLYLHNNLKLFLVTHSISSPVRLGGDMALTCRANKVNRKFIKLALKFCCRMLICVFSGRLLSMPDICHFDRTQLALGPVYESVTHYEWLSAMRSPKVSARWCRSCMLVLVISEMVVDKVHKVEEVVTKEWKNWNLYSFLVQK